MNAPTICKLCGKEVKSMKSHVDLAHRETVVATYPDGTRVEFKRLGGVFRCGKCPFEVKTTLALQSHTRRSCPAYSELNMINAQVKKATTKPEESQARTKVKPEAKAVPQKRKEVRNDSSSSSECEGNEDAGIADRLQKRPRRSATKPDGFYTIRIPPVEIREYSTHASIKRECLAPAPPSHSSVKSVKKSDTPAVFKPAPAPKPQVPSVPAPQPVPTAVPVSTPITTAQASSKAEPEKVRHRAVPLDPKLTIYAFLEQLPQPLGQLVVKFTRIGVHDVADLVLRRTMQDGVERLGQELMEAGVNMLEWNVVKDALS